MKIRSVPFQLRCQTRFGSNSIRRLPGRIVRGPGSALKRSANTWRGGRRSRVAAEPVLVLGDSIRNDLWRYVADAPPQPPCVMSSICDLLAQLDLSRSNTERVGCSVSEAHGYVLVTDQVGELIDRLGAVRVAGSLAAQSLAKAEEFS